MVAMQQETSPYLSEVSFKDWYEQFEKEWHEGEHVALVGQTGTGKTTVAHKILSIRKRVCVLAIKRQDDTLEQFRKGKPSYKIITKFPVDNEWKPEQRLILWAKPRSLHHEEIQKQSLSVYRALNYMYLQGSWCIYLDEAGYLAGVLGLSSAIGILLNQGRSAHISVVATMTRPSSVVARIPRESLTQVRHHLVFKYTDEDEMKKCAQIVGVSLGKMKQLQEELSTDTTYGFSDFVYVGKGNILVVRNGKT